MKKTARMIAVFALAPICAFAVDGVVLINQSTVMAAGGFPYVISQPGSYKLSGNLIAPVNVGAIIFSASAVTLDLNGFTVQCSVRGGQGVTCIGVSTPLHDVTLRNGIVSGSLQPGGAGNYFLGGINFFSVSTGTLESLKVQLADDDNNIVTGVPVDGGVNSIIRGNTFASNRNPPFFSCPSVIVENVNATGSIISVPSTCAKANNININ